MPLIWFSGGLYFHTELLAFAYFKFILILLQRLTFSRLAALFVSISVIGLSASANNSVWNLESLSGVQTYHSGPNCLNGVLAAKGIVSELTYIDSAEMKFFLEYYCTQTKSALALGDVLMVITENTIEHGAIFIDSKTIFEKKSASGLYSRNKDVQSSIYKKRPILESDYFSGEPTVEKYSCLSSDLIQSDLQKKCSHHGIHSLLQIIRSKFQRISLNSSLQIKDEEIPLSEVKNFTKILSELKASDHCAVYALVVGLSTFGSLFHLDPEKTGNQELKDTTDLLYNQLKNLKSKIQLETPDARVSRIIYETKGWGF